MHAVKTITHLGVIQTTNPEDTTLPPKLQALHLTHPITALEPALRAVSKAWAAHGGWPTSIPIRAIRAAWPHYGDAIGDDMKAAYTRPTPSSVTA